jgi:hypothetical protein
MGCLGEHPAPEMSLATLLPAPLACCRRELEQRRISPPSGFLLRIVIEEDAKLVRTLNRRYVDITHEGGLETIEKDALLDVISRHFTGQPWPRSGSMDATRSFMARLQSTMTAARWEAELLGAA